MTVGGLIKWHFDNLGFCVFGVLILILGISANFTYLIILSNQERILKSPGLTGASLSLGILGLLPDTKNSANMCDDDEPKAKEKKREKQVVLFLSRDAVHCSLLQRSEVFRFRFLLPCKPSGVAHESW